MKLNSSEEFQSKFELLKLEYIKKLPQMVKELSLIVNEFFQNPTEESIKNAYKAVHNLSGSSGIYGYSDISKKSKKFNKMIKPFLEETRLPTEENITLVKQEFNEYLNFLQKQSI
jgi:chemotaxis protein histidine kinase CheA